MATDHWPLQRPGIAVHGLEVGEAQRPVETVAVAAHEPHGGEVPAEILAEKRLSGSVNQWSSHKQRQCKPSTQPTLCLSPAVCSLTIAVMSCLHETSLPPPSIQAVVALHLRRGPKCEILRAADARCAKGVWQHCFHLIETGCLLEPRARVKGTVRGRWLRASK